MEIKIREKTYTIAWEFVIAPLLVILAVSILLLSNFSSARRVWIKYAEDGSKDGATISAISQTPNIKASETPAGPEKPAEEERKKQSSEVPPAESGKVQSGKININKAGMEELMSLPNIGEKKARAIMDYRASNGPFKSADELINIKGIGAKTMEKLRPLVTVED